MKKKNNPLLEQIRKDNINLRYLKLRLRNFDRFEVCLAVCRTSSTSVKHENMYKSFNFRHCYLAQLPNNEHSRQRHKRNSITISKNNDNNLQIDFTSSSALNFIDKKCLYIVLFLLHFLLIF